MSIFQSVFQRWDWQLFGAALTLVLVSSLAMVSASATLDPALAFRHGMWILLGLTAYGLVALTNYHRWFHGAVLAYGLSLIALALVLAVGTMRLGATRWMSLFGLSIQPGEIAKLATAWMLAHYLSGKPQPLSLRSFLVAFILMVVPAFFIFVQPDLGSATVFVAIWLGVIWVAGVPRRFMAWGMGCGLALLPLGWHFLKDYQRDRLLVFINPHADPLGAGYTVIQSTIAIGSGTLWGRGWFAGTQNQLNFLPERHSDFIFSVIGEEWGFFGCCVLLAAFSVLLLRILRIALESSEPQGRLLATGIFSWIGYQTFVNTGMVMGLLPVVGVPLPFLSYGGSSMLTLWVALGFLQSVHRTNR